MSNKAIAAADIKYFTAIGNIPRDFQRHIVSTPYGSPATFAPPPTSNAFKQVYNRPVSLNLRTASAPAINCRIIMPAKVAQISGLTKLWIRACCRNGVWADVCDWVCGHRPHSLQAKCRANHTDKKPKRGGAILLRDKLPT